MWPVIIAIAIPFLFVIGTIYSALKDQKRLESGPLKDLLAKKKEQRLKNLKIQSNNDKALSSNTNASINTNTLDQGHLLSRFEILDNNNRAKGKDLSDSIKDIDKLKKIDSLLNKLDTMQKTQNTETLNIKPKAYLNDDKHNDVNLNKDNFIEDKDTKEQKDLHKDIKDDKVFSSRIETKNDALNENDFLKAYKEQELEAKKRNIKNFVKTPDILFEKNAKDIIDKLDRALDEINK